LRFVIYGARAYTGRLVAEQRSYDDYVALRSARVIARPAKGEVAHGPNHQTVAARSPARYSEECRVGSVAQLG
jgi:short subunit dehydrogenase-like uncharacterized protein